MVVRVNGILLLFFKTFVVLTADQFVRCTDGLLEQQRRMAKETERIATETG